MKILSLIILTLILSSCSGQKGMTTSKIKLFGAKAFSGILYDRANNGLILYGRSNNGKSFTQKIDSDSVDIVFPNGVWNFYVVSWHVATPSADTGFSGDIFCASAEGVNLSGTDASVNLTLSNANCNSPIFSSKVYYDTASGNYKFPKLDLVSCRNLNAISSDADQVKCGINQPDGTNNKGFATWAKVVIPEYRSFNPNEYLRTGNALSSGCMEIDSNSVNGIPTTTATGTMNNFQLVEANGNGISYSIQLFYSQTACDASQGIDEMVFPHDQNTPRSKLFFPAGTHSIKAFILSGEQEICRDQRLAINAMKFAGGRGTPLHPYSICTLEQFNQISDNYSVVKDSSFELARDLDFNFGIFKPIGDPMGTLATPFSGSFNGNNHSISHIILESNGNLGVENNNVGIIRSINRLNGSSPIPIISNLTINKFATMGFDKNDHIGILAGQITDGTISNVRAFGYVEGASYAGGLVGELIANLNNVDVTNVHAETFVKSHLVIGHDNKGAGGILGAINNTGTTKFINVRNVSFKGQVEVNEDTKYIELSSTVYGAISESLPVNFCTISGCTTPVGKILEKITINILGTNHYYLRVEVGPGLTAINTIQTIIGANAYPKSGTVIGPVLYAGIGGIAGWTHGLAASTLTIDRATVISDRMTGPGKMGGVIGLAEYTTIRNTFAQSSMQSLHWGEAMSNTYIGGIVGYMANVSIQFNLALGHREFLTGESVGGTYGGGSASLSSNYYIGEAVSPKSGETLRYPSSTTSIGAFNKNTYDTAMFFTSYGNGAPTVAGTQGDTYYDFINNKCYSKSSISWGAPNDCASYTMAWIMPADGYNFPRLANELYLENKVPYLKRMCTTAAEFQATPLTAVDGGNIICTLSQLTPKGTAGDITDHLGQNIYFDTSTALTTTPQFSSGIYKLYGHGKSIINYRTKGPGLFSILNQGSLIADLTFIGYLKDIGSSSMGNAVGLLAQFNLGNVINVKTLFSSIKVNTNPELSNSFTTLGGLIGNNVGMISGGEINTNLIIYGETVAFTGANAFYVGAVTGASNGNINSLKAYGEILRSGFTSNLPQEYYAGISGYAEGTISQIEIRPYIQFDGTGGIHAAPVYGYSPAGVILSDFKVQTKLTLLNATTTSFNLFQNAGTISRGFFDIGEMSSYINDFTGNNSGVFYYTTVTTGVTPAANMTSGLSFEKSANGTPLLHYSKYDGSNWSTNLIFDFYGWNMGSDLVSSWNNQNTWREEFKNTQITSVNIPELVKTSGNFEEIGLGF